LTHHSLQEAPLLSRFDLAASFEVAEAVSAALVHLAVEEGYVLVRLWLLLFLFGIDWVL